MTTLSVKFRASTIANKEGAIYYQLIHMRQVKLLTSRFRILPKEWDRLLSKVIIQTTDSQRAAYLLGVSSAIEAERTAIESLIAVLQNQREYTVSEVVDYYRSQARSGYLFPFMQHLIALLKDAGQHKTASTYITALRNFKEFNNHQDIHFERLNGTLIKRLEMYLRGKKVSNNSISCYMRVLRAVYNRAVECGLTAQRRPFAHVYTGIAKTVKRAVGQQVMVNLQTLDLTSRPDLAEARELFMFSFYTRGMSFVDMARLTKQNINDGILTYRRSKTGQSLSIKVEPCIAAIIERYSHLSANTDYLLPILTGNSKDYDSALRKQNRRLRVLSSLLNLSKPLSSYVSRHSWATLAASKGVPVQVISEGMGHENERTTRIYLASLESSLLDNANALIINLEK